MSVTIHYRGSLANPDRIEDFEDRVIDLVLDLGGQARVWRSAADDRPDRIVRGLIVTIEPGHESLSLLVAPEGWLIGLIEIEDAEKGRLISPPWCSTKTQYGTLLGHVAIVELLRALKREFLPDLEVNDEAEYWETSDANLLARRFEFLDRAIEAFGDALERHPLSSEAAEDPDILVSRIERIARLVQRTIGRPSEHPPAGPDEDDGSFDGPRWSEADWDAAYRENRRRQERMERNIEERQLRGESIEEAFEAALRDEIPPPLQGEEESDLDDEDIVVGEPWDDDEDEAATAESLPVESEEADDDDFDAVEPERRPLPLLERSRKLWKQLHDEFSASNEGEPSPHVRILFQGLGDLGGGLAQALSREAEFGEGELDELDAGLAIVQLKRALRGIAFAWGALAALRSDQPVGEEKGRDFHAALDEMSRDILARLATLRRQLGQ